MWTITYKGWYILGYCDKPEYRVYYPGLGSTKVKSLHAAKIFITKAKQGVI